MTISHYLTRPPRAAENRCLNSSRVDCANLLKSGFFIGRATSSNTIPHDLTQLRWGRSDSRWKRGENEYGKREGERSIG